TSWDLLPPFELYGTEREVQGKRKDVPMYGRTGQGEASHAEAGWTSRSDVDEKVAAAALCEAQDLYYDGEDDEPPDLLGDLGSYVYEAGRRIQSFICYVKTILFLHYAMVMNAYLGKSFMAIPMDFLAIHRFPLLPEHGDPRRYEAQQETMMHPEYLLAILVDFLAILLAILVAFLVILIAIPVDFLVIHRLSLLPEHRGLLVNKILVVMRIASSQSWRTYIQGDVNTASRHTLVLDFVHFEPS
ncbi:unnamed protein product, partial [Symbiodinium sp. KB8]